MKLWHIIELLLLLTAALFFFVMNGYTYISLTLVYIAALIAVFHSGCPLLIRTVSIITAVGLLYFFAVEALIISSARTDPNPERSYLIVLGAKVQGDQPSLSLQHRLEGALDYLTKYPSSTAVVSGGQGSGETVSEAECMKNWLLGHGIPDERILTENRSTTTDENLRFSWKLIQTRGGRTDDVAILSSNYHLYRAKAMARALGLQPVGVRGTVGYPIYTLGMFIREAFGVTHLWVFGN